MHYYPLRGWLPPVTFGHKQNQTKYADITENIWYKKKTLTIHEGRSDYQMSPHQRQFCLIRSSRLPMIPITPGGPGRICAKVCAWLIRWIGEEKNLSDGTCVEPLSGGNDATCRAPVPVSGHDLTCGAPEWRDVDVMCRAPLKTPPVLRCDKMVLIHQLTDSTCISSRTLCVLLRLLCEYSQISVFICKKLKILLIRINPFLTTNNPAPSLDIKSEVGNGNGFIHY